jgi:hypothetical protein
MTTNDIRLVSFIKYGEFLDVQSSFPNWGTVVRRDLISGTGILERTLEFDIEFVWPVTKTSD